MKPDTFSHRLSPRHRFPSVFCFESEIRWFNLWTGRILFQFNWNGENMKSVPVMGIWRWKKIPWKSFNLTTQKFMVFHERWLIFEAQFFSFYHQSKTTVNINNVVLLSQLNRFDMIWVVFDFSAHFFMAALELFPRKLFDIRNEIVEPWLSQLI